MGAAVEKNRGRDIRRSLHGRSEIGWHGLDRARPQVNLQQGVGCGDERVIGLWPRLLQAQAFFAQLVGSAVLGQQFVRGLVENHGRFSHCRQLELPNRGKLALLRLLCQRSHPVQGLLLRGDGDNHSVPGDGGVAIHTKFKQRRRRNVVELQVADRGDHPELALRRHDRQIGSAIRNLGTLRNLDRRGHLGGCRVHRFDAAGRRVVHEEGVAILQHIELRARGHNGSVEFVDLAVEATAEQLLTIGNPHIA